VGRIDWAGALDFELAAENVRGEFVGDWHRDPWGWPELGYMLTREPELLVANLDSSGARRAALIDVPKENWGSRPAVVLDIVDRLTFQAVVDRLSLDLIGAMPRSIYGWRLHPKDPAAGKYSHNSLQWEEYRHHLRLAAACCDVALKTDIVSFFATIPLELIRDSVDDRAPQGAVARRLISLLEGFDTIPERSGLPQRSRASAVLANLILGPLDDVLAHHSIDLPTLRLLGKPKPAARQSFTRWMDDIWLFGDSAAHIRRAQTELQEAARSLGLNLNLGKTRVLEGAEVSEDALQIEHSAVDDALGRGNIHTPLEELADKLLEHPEISGRTSLKFMASRMRKHNCTHRHQDFIAQSVRMPHAADELAPLFKSWFKSPSLQDWFLDYSRGEWASFQWSTAQYARMFPSNRIPQKATRDFFAEIIASADTSLPLLAVAAQRLAAWDPGEARVVVRAALARTSHPQPRRVLALAALGAGEPRANVRRWLKQEPENDVTLRMLEYYNYGTPKLDAHYAN
jgi:hypothetical protein